MKNLSVQPVAIMSDLWKQLTLSRTDAQDAQKTESIQSLWSGYGEIFRAQLSPEFLGTIVVKQIKPPAKVDHPRGWNTDLSATRKLRSYEVETNWYTQWSQQCNDHCRVPSAIACASDSGESVILLEDLDASGFDRRHSHLGISQAKPCLYWLAHFHAQFIHSTPNDLWPVGTYWHLDTRSDEFDAMASGALKSKARQLDQLLSTCKYRTIVHGDAKVANFCFRTDDQQVAAVDFQYVGGGCGMKDVAYFLGSCFDEHELELWVPSLLDYYFEVLREAIAGKDISTTQLETEWRSLFAPAWTDFYRFLLGWMPEHSKINSFTEKLAKEALTQWE